MMLDDHLKAAAEELPGLLYRRLPGSGSGPVFLAGPVEELTGWSAEALAREGGWPSLIHEADRARVRRETRRALREGGEYAMTYRIAAPGGPVRWVADRGRALPAKPGSGPALTGIILDITEQREAEERARWISNHDSLTLLPNRLLFLQHLAERLADSAAAPFALLLLDLDGLRRVNDSEGHVEGDRLLCDVAAQLSRCAGPGAFKARVGGDEFVCILDAIPNMAEAQRRCSAFHGAVAAALPCRLTMGAALFPADGRTREELLKHADIALNAAKADARGDFRIFEPEMRSRMQRQASMLSLGRQALNAGKIVPNYQPKINLVTNEVTGLEALLRWWHPSGGTRLPADIQACFDEPDMAVELTDAMLTSILADIRRWRELGLPFGHVALNVSTFDFSRRDFAVFLMRRLEEAALPPGVLQIEVTESVMLGRHAVDVERALRRLSTAGVAIALDDFGTGFASLTHLCRFPADVLKIDRSFVQADEGDEAGAAAIVGSIIGLAHNLGMKAVAEGVETEEQRDKLLLKGCDEAQGFLYSKAVPAERVSAMLHKLSCLPRLAA
jgi:diguanylate cyclase (GGDEF)-like protein/PAS domain S-box-containing protein